MEGYMKRYKLFSAMSLMMLAMLFFFGCDTDKKDNKIVIGTFSKAIDYGPFFVARHYGWFEKELSKHGITEVEYIEFMDRAAIGAALQGSKLDMIFAAEAPIIVTNVAGVDVKIRGLSCTLQQEILVRNGTNIGSVNDLRGKRIAVLAATSSHYGLLKILTNAGLDVSEIDLYDYGPSEAMVSFESGNIDAWAVWPPFVEKEVLNNNGHVLGGGDAVIQSVYAFPINAEKRDVYRDIANVVEESKKWILNNPEEAKSIVAKEIGESLDVVEAAWPKHLWSASLDSAVILDIQQKADFLSEQNNTKAINVTDELIYSE